MQDIQNQQIDEIFCLGDIIGYGPSPRECIDLVAEFQLCILGNHDQAALFDPEGFSSTAERTFSGLVNSWNSILKNLKEPNVVGGFLAELPRTHQVDEFLFVHGSGPKSDQ